MKILNVIGSNKKGGAEQFFIRHALAMRERGVDQVIAVREGGWVEEKLRALGISPVAFTFGGALDLRTRGKVDKLIRNEQPDVILSWMGRAAQHVPKTGTPHITRLGNYYPLKHYKHCDYFIGITPDIADYIVKEGVRADRVDYIPNFLDSEPAAPIDREALDTPPDVPLILWLGRMTHSKGPDVLVKALSKVSDAHLWMAGIGDMEDELRGLVHNLGIQDRVHFLGWREDIFNLLSAADLYVCASRHEAHGNVILEAWAQSTPVVAARSPGPEHLIQHGQTGILADNDCPGSMAAALSLLIENPQRAEAIGAAGQRYLAENFGREAIIGQYIALFEKAKQCRV
jgi:glycosyltransferase involved in cell wall biosynthesis